VRARDPALVPPIVPHGLSRPALGPQYQTGTNPYAQGRCVRSRNAAWGACAELPRLEEMLSVPTRFDQPLKRVNTGETDVAGQDASMSINPYLVCEVRMLERFLGNRFVGPSSSVPRLESQYV